MGWAPTDLYEAAALPVRQSPRPWGERRGEGFAGVGPEGLVGSSPFPSCVLPQPEIMHFRPTGNFLMPGLYWGWSTARLSPIFTGFPPMPVRDAVPRWARTSSTFVLPTRGRSDTPLPPGRQAQLWGPGSGEGRRGDGGAPRLLPKSGPRPGACGQGREPLRAHLLWLEHKGPLVPCD